MTKTLIILFFTLSTYVVSAQIPKDNLLVDTSVFPKEKTALSINSDVLLAGELLQYKAYNLDVKNKVSELSKVLYVSMRSDKDSVVFSHKLRINNGAANGDFFIPSTLKTGVYKLISYTNFSRNNKQDAFAHKNIYVLNTFINTTEIKEAEDSIQINPKPQFIEDFSGLKNSNQELKITSNKKIYGLREKVILNLESTIPDEVKGNFVLSIRKTNPLEIIGDFSENIEHITSENFYIPELRGEIISGTVLNIEDNSAVALKEVSLTIPGEDNFVFKTVKTDLNGRFFFSVAEGYNAEKSIIQVVTSTLSNFNYEIKIDTKQPSLSEMKSTMLNLNPEIKSWLQERSVQLQIENAYFETKKDSVLMHKINSRFFNNLGTVFMLDDYTRFPSVRETFIEVVTLAAIRGTAANSRFLVYNAYDPNGIAKFNEIPPLILMDGVQIINNELLLNYNAREIKSIRVITEPYRYGPTLYSGIIMIETIKGDFFPLNSNNSAKEFELLPAVEERIYYKPTYNLTSNKLSRIPDYRVQLLWNPKVSILNNGILDSLFTSDITGIFEILLEGFDSSGNFLTTSHYILVR